MNISVIIPTYNRAELVLQAVESVLAQTRPADEIIVVDDGSSDDTLQLLSPLEDRGRVRLLSCQHSGMPGAVRNRGVEAAGGDYIAFLDSDDLWRPEKLAAQIAHGPSRLVHTRELWNRSGREISQKSQRHARSGNMFADALKKCIIGPSTVLLQRSLLEACGGFREDVQVAEDYELWLHLTAKCDVQYVDRPLVEKRAGHGGQLSERFGAIEYFRLRSLLDFCGYHEHMPAPPGLPGLAANAARRAEGLREPQRQAAVEELGYKLRVFAAGAEKRGNQDVAEWCRTAAGQLGQG